METTRQRLFSTLIALVCIVIIGCGPNYSQSDVSEGPNSGGKTLGDKNAKGPDDIVAKP